MWFGVITLFPAMFDSLTYGITGRALKNRLIELQTWDLRQFAEDKYRSVDDYPYGGGPGLILLAEPILAAIHAAKAAAPTPPKVIYLTPQGRLFNQQAALKLSKSPSLILLSGRYEGIDERIIDQNVDEEWSIGDYILTGGELPAMVMIDALTRLLPFALGDQQSSEEDSFSKGLLKYPQYTSPQNLAGNEVPPLLLSGHHEHIRKWRLKQSLGRTWLRRPDLLAKIILTEEENLLLAEFKAEIK